MKIALLGATGFVGSALLKEALRRGHTVTAIARHPKKLEEHERLIAKAGDIYDTAGLAALIHGNDALMSAFNPGWKNPNLYDDQVRGTTSIIAAVKKAGLTRAPWVGGAGGLEMKPGVRVVDSPDMPDWMWSAKGTGARVIFSGRRLQMQPGERAGKFRLGTNQLPVDAKGQSRISVQDYAVAMIGELENPAHIRQRFTVGY